MLDETMHNSIVSFCVSGGDTNRKGAIVEVSVNNPRPTFNNGEDGVLSSIVLVVGMKLVCVVTPYGSMVVMFRITLVGSINPWGS